MLSPRERVLTAMRRQVPDRVPKYADFTPEIYRLYLQKTGQAAAHHLEEWKGRPGVTYRGDLGFTDPADYFRYDVRVVEFGETTLPYDFSAYLPESLPVGRTRVSEWGIAYVRGSESHFESMVHPLANVTSVNELERYPWPDLMADYRRSVARQRIQEVHDRGLAAIGWPPLKGGTFFETAWGLRGFEALLEDLMVRQDLAACLLDKIAGLSIASYEFLAEAGADILMLGDDFGMQERLLLSPLMWRRWTRWTCSGPCGPA